MTIPRRLPRARCSFIREHTNVPTSTRLAFWNRPLSGPCTVRWLWALGLLISLLSALFAVSARGQNKQGKKPESSASQDPYYRKFGDLSGTWEYEGNSVRVFHNGPILRGILQNATCPHGGQRDELFLGLLEADADGNLSMSGFIKHCTTIKQFITDCGCESVWLSKFDAQVIDQTFIDGHWKGQYWKYDEKDGKWVNCRKDSEYDEDFKLKRILGSGNYVPPVVSPNPSGPHPTPSPTPGSAKRKVDKATKTFWDSVWDPYDTH